MSSIQIRKEKAKRDTLILEWDKNKGFISKVNGQIQNYYGRDESLAKRRFSSKLSYWRKYR